MVTKEEMDKSVNYKAGEIVTRKTRMTGGKPTCSMVESPDADTHE